jgi:polyisoprenyl-phosphate glycosyltransferase
MRYVFLTACRNESRILAEFLEEFAAVVAQTGIATDTLLYVIDDLSTDDTLQKLREYEPAGWNLRVIEAPTNFGNQGALFLALQQVDVGPEDVLITFDCDGEDDVSQFPSILELGRENPGKLVMIERGRRSESLTFRVMFMVYKAMFRVLTGRKTIPNNFMLIPGRCLPAIRRSPLTPAHLAYGIQKLGFPSVSTVRDRRPRYGGKSSQSLFALMTHGLVGLMVFYEEVVAKLFFLLTTFATVMVGLGVVAAIGEETTRVPEAALGWTAAGLGVGAILALGLLLSSSLVLFLKILSYTLSAGDDGRREESKPPAERDAGSTDDVRAETPDTEVRSAVPAACPDESAGEPTAPEVALPSEPRESERTGVS